jgi:hypothetical protein
MYLSIESFAYQSRANACETQPHPGDAGAAARPLAPHTAHAGKRAKGWANPMRD